MTKYKQKQKKAGRNNQWLTEFETKKKMTAAL